MSQVQRMFIWLFFIYIIVETGPLAALAHEGSQHKPAARAAFDRDLDDALWLLPEDSETISVSSGPFKLDVFSVYNANVLVRGSAFESFPLLPLELLRSPAVTEHLEGREVKLAIEGSKTFRVPGDIGSFRYTGCHIVLFNKELANSGLNFMESLEQKATSKGIINKKTYIIIKHGDFNFHFCMIKPNCLAITTDRESLRLVINRSGHRGTKRALPDELPHWSKVDIQSRFWGIRIYGKGHFDQDPTSPLNQGGIHSADQDAIGVVFAYDAKSQIIILRYLTNSKFKSELNKKIISSFNLRHEIDWKINDTYIEYKFKLLNRNDAIEIRTLIYSFFGHTIVI